MIKPTIDILTMCFCKAELLEWHENYMQRKLTSKHKRHITLNHWPIDEIENNKKLIAIANNIGANIFDQGFDRGLQKAFNNWFFTVHPENYVLGYDADATCQRIGFDEALLDVMLFDKSISVCALRNPGTELNIAKGLLKPQLLTTNNGIKYFIHPSVEMFDIAIYDAKWIRAINGFDQPHEFYGGLESWLYMQRGFRLAYLWEYVQNKVPIPENCTEPKYRLWKDAHLAGYKASFATWLRETYPQV